MVSQAKLILRVITLLFLVSSQFFRVGMGPFKVSKRLICLLEIDYNFDPKLTRIMVYDE